MSDSLFYDTNVFIRLLADDEQVYELLNGRMLCLSVITEMELQCKPDFTTSDLALIRSLLNDCLVLSLTDLIKEQTIRIRRTTRLKLMDAIVTASAVAVQMPLVTGDRMFERVTGTSVILLPAT